MNRYKPPTKDEINTLSGQMRMDRLREYHEYLEEQREKDRMEHRSEQQNQIWLKKVIQNERTDTDI